MKKNQTFYKAVVSGLMAEIESNNDIQYERLKQLMIENLVMQEFIMVSFGPTVLESILAEANSRNNADY